MDKEIDIKKLLRDIGYKGKLFDQLADALKGLTHLSSITNAYKQTPNKIYGEDKWILLQKLYAEAVKPELVPAPAKAIPAKK